MGVDARGGDGEERGEISLELHVNVYTNQVGSRGEGRSVWSLNAMGTTKRTKSSVKSRGSTTSYSIPPQTLHSLILNPFVSSQASKVCARKIEDNLSPVLDREGMSGIVGVLAWERKDDAGTGTGGTDYDGRERTGSGGGKKGLGRPLGYQVVDFLWAGRETA